MQKTSLVYFSQLVCLHLLGFRLLNAAVGTAIDVQQGHQTTVTDIYWLLLVLPALRVEHVAFRLMVLSRIGDLIFGYQRFVNQRAANPFNYRFGLAGRLDLVFKDAVLSFSFP